MSAAVDLRTELLQIEASLSRDALWQDAGVNLPNPRAALESRRDALMAELSQQLPSTKVTTLKGYEFEHDSHYRPGGLTLFNGRRGDEDHLDISEDLLPDGTVEGVEYDFEITITRRPHVAGPKQEGA